MRWLRVIFFCYFARWCSTVTRNECEFNYKYHSIINSTQNDETIKKRIKTMENSIYEIYICGDM
jgi:hypothetical protein